VLPASKGHPRYHNIDRPGAPVCPCVYRLPLQLTLREPSHTMQLPANLPGCGLAELGAYPAGYEFRDLLLSDMPGKLQREAASQACEWFSGPEPA
jgi:hypothetical protein